MFCLFSKTPANQIQGKSRCFIRLKQKILLNQYCHKALPTMITQGITDTRQLPLVNGTEKDLLFWQISIFLSSEEMQHRITEPQLLQRVVSKLKLKTFSQCSFSKKNIISHLFSLDASILDRQCLGWNTAERALKSLFGELKPSSTGVWRPYFSQPQYESQCQVLSLPLVHTLKCTHNPTLAALSWAASLYRCTNSIIGYTLL